MSVVPNGHGAVEYFNQVAPPGVRYETGVAQGTLARTMEMDARQRWAPPTVTRDQDARPVGEGPKDYNRYAAPPVKYDTPSHYKEHFQNKQAIREATGARIIDPISDQEVEHLQNMKDQAEVADIDTYVNSKYNLRNWHDKEVIMKFYPEFIERRLKQLRADHDFAIKNQCIDQYGITNRDDFYFKYLVDQGKIDGPRLGKHVKLSDSYAPGLLSPWAFLSGADRRKGGVYMPFASANYGERPRNTADKERNWKITENAPLNEGRDTQTLADSMYKLDLRTNRMNPSYAALPVD